MAPRQPATDPPDGGRAAARRSGIPDAAAAACYPRVVRGQEAQLPEPTARARGLDPRNAIENRRGVMLATLRSQERGSLAQHIFDETAIAIVEGRLRPGQTLNSVELARRFATSRTPVREALTELERQGAVARAPRQRPRVAQTTMAQLKDIYDLRASLFTLVSELIVDNCPASQLAGLWTWQAALEDDAARGRVDDYFWHHAGFRLAETRLADNEGLQRIIGALAMRAMQVTHLSFSLPRRLDQSAADHRRLLLAYEERDKVTAVAVNRLMIMTGYRALQESGLIKD